MNQQEQEAVEMLQTQVMDPESWFYRQFIGIRRDVGIVLALIERLTTPSQSAREIAEGIVKSYPLSYRKANAVENAIASAIALLEAEIERLRKEDLETNRTAGKWMQRAIAAEARMRELEAKLANA